jgi:hypothetical protein
MTSQKNFNFPGTTQRMRLATKSHKTPQNVAKRHKRPQKATKRHKRQTPQTSQKHFEPQRHNHAEEEEEEGDRLKQGDGAVIRGGGTS